MGAPLLVRIWCVWAWGTWALGSLWLLLEGA